MSLAMVMVAGSAVLSDVLRNLNFVLRVMERICAFRRPLLLQYGEKKKQGIWFTRYAYGHNIWQTQGI